MVEASSLGSIFSISGRALRFFRLGRMKVTTCTDSYTITHWLKEVVLEHIKRYLLDIQEDVLSPFFFSPLTKIDTA